MRELLKLIEERFKSGNSIDVERITITRAEYEAELAKPEQDAVSWYKYVNDEQLIDETRVRGFKIRDDQISPCKEWRGLTDDEIRAIEQIHSCSYMDHWIAIEAKLKEKNA